MVDNQRIKLEKRLCYLLRHNPNKGDLVLDEQGFCDIRKITKSLNITVEELTEIVNLSDKHRFEIVNDKVRALYGHSINQKVVKKEIEPPNYLYHGTTHNAYELIKEEGLKPMNRQYVHLSFDLEIAKAVGNRRDNKPIVLLVKAKEAYQDGYKFYEGNNHTILANVVPAKYLEIINDVMHKGIFWIVDQEELENNNDYFFFIKTNKNGEIIEHDYDLTSKNKDNYNHKLTWELLPKKLTHNKDFNYYPRGRVEIKSGKHKLFLNPLLLQDRILDYIKKRFELNDDVVVIADNSKHYQSEI